MIAIRLCQFKTPVSDYLIDVKSIRSRWWSVVDQSTQPVELTFKLDANQSIYVAKLDAPDFEVQRSLEAASGKLMSF